MNYVPRPKCLAIYRNHKAKARHVCGNINGFDTCLLDGERQRTRQKQKEKQRDTEMSSVDCPHSIAYSSSADTLTIIHNYPTTGTECCAISPLVVFFRCLFQSTKFIISCISRRIFYSCSIFKPTGTTGPRSSTNFTDASAVLKPGRDV